MGIEENQLHKISKEVYLKDHFEFNSLSEEMKNKHYEHFEEIRKNKLEKAIKMREKIINNYKNEKTIEDNSPKTTSNNFKKIKRNNSFQKKEKEYLKLLKKQNLREIKILIDNTYNTRKKQIDNEKKIKNELQKEEELKLQKKLEKDKKVIEDIKRDYDNIEREKSEKKRKEKEYKEIIKKQIEDKKKEEERQKN